LDPREFAMVAFGGAGPLHACAVADELGITRIVVPQHPGLFCAHGLLEAELHTHDIRAVLQSTGKMDHAALQRWFEQSEERARISLIAQGVQPQTIGFRRQYDARYRGQSFELTIDHGDCAESIAQRFHEAHRSRYGYDVPGEIVELVNARLTGTGRLPSRDAVPLPPAGLMARREEKRRLWLDGAFIDVPVLQRGALEDGTRVQGPAIVEEYDCTTYLAPEWLLCADRGVLLLEKAAE